MTQCLPWYCCNSAAVSCPFVCSVYSITQGIIGYCFIRRCRRSFNYDSKKTVLSGVPHQAKNYDVLILWISLSQRRHNISFDRVVVPFDKKQHPVYWLLMRCAVVLRNGVKKMVIVDKKIKKLMVKLRKLLTFLQVCVLETVYRVVSYSLAYTNKHN